MRIFAQVVLFLTVLFSASQALGQSDKHASSLNINILNFSVKPMAELEQGSCQSSDVSHTSWSQMPLAALPRHQHLCLRRDIKIHSDVAAIQPVLVTGMLAAADYYWDGELVGSNGRPASSAQDETPGNVQNMLALSRQNLAPGEHVLAIELSTFHVEAELRQIGYVALLTESDPVQKQILFISVIAAVLIGCLLSLTAIFQLLYWRYHANKSVLTFSYLCLFSALLVIAEQWKLWVFYPYDWHIFRLVTIVLLASVSSALMPLFYALHYGLAKIARLGGIYVLLVAICVLALKESETIVLALFGLSLIASLLIAAIALKNKIKGSGWHTAVLSLTILVLATQPFFFAELGFAAALLLLMPVMLSTLVAAMRKERNAALQATRIRTEMLRRSLQPHFLMNSLTHLTELIEVKPKQAAVFISDLADEFRSLIKSSEQKVVSLISEVALCRKHLEIMSSRYQCNYALSIHGEMEGIKIPPLVLHNLIENAFTHNRISNQQQFELSVIQESNQLRLCLKSPVENLTQHQGTGIGQDYVKAKLTEVFGENWSFTQAHEQGFWVCRLVLPNVAEKGVA